MGVSRIIHRSAKVVAAAYDRVRPPDPGITILAYHRVGGGSGLEIDLDVEVFTDQMRTIAGTVGAQTIDGALAQLLRGGPVGRSPVVVTFDDGTADFVDSALPALVESSIPATYYISTKFIEEQRAFPEDGRPMSWAALAEALSTGLVTVGSHTHSHAVMDKLTPAEARDELLRSQQLIEDRLGVEAEHFAYPKGVFGGPAVGDVVAARFTSAALADGAANPPGTSAHRLDRTPVQRSDGTRYFERKLVGGMRLEGDLRRLLNAGRYRSRRH